MLNLKAALFEAFLKASRVLLVELMPEPQIPIANRALVALAKADQRGPLASLVRDSPLPRPKRFAPLFWLPTSGAGEAANAWRCKFAVFPRRLPGRRVPI